ncbi:MAG: transcriptional repressor LexA [Candidatus Omnitrophica bacterium]|nr:transcriptional repressor LexA [Candidatus Omnitrophota bacterium]MBU0881045.1 transcriptional repressor LexA [Candidatus Omnitrophota bacterium]MBU0895650.1 transcriptional repressor LexA [Candidatus Omnitrophota bacterium]MBU1038540.1 transcriptional repressor LexA [Candidatus Omnitrophota bacterium]MBU1809212.1 transcriptional repressor LexA [Candidatus Omnitrophota bacterium]
MDKVKVSAYLRRLESFYSKADRMPSYSEMLQIFGLKSKNAVYKRVARLVREGLVRKDRTGRLIPLARINKPVRLLGLIQAGFPSPAEEEAADLISIDEYLISNPQATYLLKVDGDSMIDAGIHPGDLVLVQRDLEARHGDIVVASVDREWTLKYFERDGGKVVLRAANSKYTLIKPSQELLIAGVVIANVRKYK